MHWYTFMNTLGRPVEQLAVCLANKQKSAVEVKVQSYAKPAQEEVRNGDVTIGVKRVWNVITAEKFCFCRPRSILLPLLFEAYTGAGPLDALEVQSSTKVS